MSTKKVIKRITALILTVALVMVNVPTGSIFAENDTDSEYEAVKFKISVNDSQGNAMSTEDGIIFELVEQGVHSDIVYTQLTEEKESQTDTTVEPESGTDKGEQTGEENDNQEATSTESSQTQQMETSSVTQTETVTTETTSTEVELIYTNTYELTVDKKIDKDLVIKVYEAGHPEHVDYITYNGDATYTATLTRYAAFDYATYANNTLNSKDVIFEEGEYTYETDFAQNSSEFVIAFKHPVKCELVATATKSVNSSVCKVYESGTEDGCKWKIDYQTAGDITVRITPASLDDVQFEETTLVLDVNNKLEFLCANNQNTEGVIIEADENDSKYVGCVKKTISSDGETVKLNLSALDTSSIEYSISNADSTKSDKTQSLINSADGTVTIKSAEPVIVTATCALTNETAQYKIVPVPTVNAISVNINDKVIDKIFGIQVFTGYTEYFLDVNMDLGFGKEIEDYYELSYDFEPDNVFALEEETGKIKVLAMSDKAVSVTITATPKSGVYYYDTSTYGFDLNVEQIVPNVTFYYDDEILSKDATKTLYDMIDNSDLYQNEDGNWCLDIPISATLNYEGEDLDDYCVVLSSEGIDFKGTTITNADEILRNKEFTIDVIVSDNVADGEAKRFIDIPFSFKCILEGW